MSYSILGLESLFLAVYQTGHSRSTLIARRHHPPVTMSSMKMMAGGRKLRAADAVLASRACELERSYASSWERDLEVSSRPYPGVRVLIYSSRNCPWQVITRSRFIHLSTSSRRDQQAVKTKCFIEGCI